MNPTDRLSCRLATTEDIPAIEGLMRLSIAENMKPFLSPEEIEAAKETMEIVNEVMGVALVP